MQAVMVGIARNERDSTVTDGDVLPIFGHEPDLIDTVPRIMIRFTRPSSRSRPGKTWVVVVAALAAVGVGIAVSPYVREMLGNNNVKPDGDAKAATPTRVTALGRLQPAAGVIPVYGPPGDRIAKFYDKDGKPIGPGTMLKAGDPIVDLASKDLRDREVKVATIQLRESEEQVKAAKAAGEKKIVAAEAEKTQMLANRENDLKALQAKVDYLVEAKSIAEGQVSRLEKLKKEMVSVAEEDIEKGKLAIAQARAEHIAAVAMLEKTKNTYDQGAIAADAKIDAAREELKEAVAKAPIESSKEKLELAKEMAKLTTITAPVDGTVLKVAGRDGQPTGLEPILQLAPLGEMVAIAEVYESDLQRLTELLKKGPVTAEIKSEALPGDHILHGQVLSENDVTRMIAKNQVFSLGPREDSDRRVVEVLVRLNPADAQAASRYIGLQVTIVLNPGK